MMERLETCKECQVLLKTVLKLLKTYSHNKRVFFSLKIDFDFFFHLCLRFTYHCLSLQDLGVHKVGHLKRIQHGIKELVNRMAAMKKYCNNY